MKESYKFYALLVITCAILNAINYLHHGFDGLDGSKLFYEFPQCCIAITFFKTLYVEIGM